MRYRIEMPGDDGGAEVARFVAAWLEHPALKRIVIAEGGTWPAGTLEERAAALHTFSEQWDFRAGAERLDASVGSTTMPEDALRAAASELGLMSASRPDEGGDFAHALALGGTALASIYRVRYLFDIRSTVHMNAVGVLTALRDLSYGERRLVEQRADIAPLVQAAASEFDVMVAAVERFGGVRADVEQHRNEEQPNRASAEARAGDATVLAAPSSEPGRRANTRDNYDVYKQRITPGQRVMIVTSSIYLPYQFFVAIQALGWQRPLTIEAVGFPPEWMEGVLTGPLNVLQELRSGLFGAATTLAALRA